MSDALPLPPRPNIEQYKNLARDFQRACKAGDPAAIRSCALRWMERLAALGAMSIHADERAAVERAANQMERRWQKLRGLKTPSYRRPDRRAECLLANAQFFVAREHGFASWPKFVEHLEMLGRPDSIVSQYEAAVDAIVGGDIATLERLLRANRNLVRARSTREHRSTLLHYVSANGVEDFRQKTPRNIVEITRLLLDAGADVNATSDAYGGGSTTLGLVGTSVHPEEAGVQIPLMELLLEHGARVDQQGAAGNGHPVVKGCLANGQGAAARFLAGLGVPLDLEEAAGVGRLDLVKRYFTAHGALTNGATVEQLTSGFLYACGYGRTEVAEFLLQKGIDPNVATPQGQTALHWVAYGPHVEVGRLLLQHHADVNARDAMGRTPLQWAEQTLQSATDPEDVRRARELAQLLREAGASS